MRVPVTTFCESPNRKDHPRYAANCILVVGLCLACPFARGDDYRTVALMGAFAIGAESGAVFGSFKLPLINDFGQIAFVGNFATGVAGVTAGSDSAIWRENADSLEMVAREGFQAPGTGPGQVFDDFNRSFLPGGSDFSSQLAINNAGQIAFDALLRSQPGVTPDNQFGIWKTNSSILNSVARTGDHAPGTPEGAVFEKLNPPWLDGSGQVAFNASLLRGEGGVTNDDYRGAWMEREGPLSLFSRQGTVGNIALSSGQRLSAGAIIGLNRSGQFVAEGALLVGTAGVTEDDNQVLWTNALGMPKIIIREGDQLPGTAIGTKFTGSYYLNGVSWNEDGELAFFAALPGPPEPGSGIADVGIWSENNGSLNLVARRGGSVPGMPGAQFRDFSGLSSNLQGHVAFLAELRPGLGGVGELGASGIWAHDNQGVLNSVASSGSPAPGTDGLTFQFFDDFVMNNLGQVAFEVRTSATLNGIWARDIDGVVKPIAVPGQMIDVDNGPGIDTRTVRSANFLGDSRDSRRRYRGFNDRGQLAFIAQFTDGSSGIFVSSTVSVVPEPYALVLAISAALISLYSRCLRPA